MVIDSKGECVSRYRRHSSLLTSSIHNVTSGTRITVGGTEIPVASDGLFMKNVRLSRNNTIVVAAENEGGKKVIVRSFEALY